MTIINIIGIDPSLAGTAMCDFVPADPSIYSVTTFKTKPDQFPNMVRRLDKIVENVMNVMLACDPSTTKVFIEGFSYGSRGSSLFEIAGVGYMIRSALIKAGFGYFDVPPTTLKMFTCYNGGAKKDLMLLSCYQRYGQDHTRLKDDNQVDAYCLARFGEHYLRWINNKDAYFNKKELQAFEKIGSEII